GSAGAIWPKQVASSPRCLTRCGLIHCGWLGEAGGRQGDLFLPPILPPAPPLQNCWVKVREETAVSFPSG
ncbi:MAG: hypothetical protein KC421_15575, partial [Anaerolineales bacterium]|nr:hypothetical protein [Anaerolineales bacterium]